MKIFERLNLKGLFKKVKILCVSLIVVCNRVIKNLFSKINNEKVRSFFSSKKLHKLIIYLFLFIALIETVFAVMIYGFKAEDTVTKTVAKVIPYPYVICGFDVITYNNYLAEKAYIHHFYSATQQENIDFSAIDDEILNQLVENKIIDHEAIQNDISVSDGDVNKTIDQIIDQNGGKESVDKVLNELYGLNINGFKKLVKTQLLREKVNDKVIARVTARHILVRVDSNAPQEKVDEAKGKIDQYLNEVKNGLDFGEAAKKYSEDIGSAENGGLLESFAVGEMVEAFSEVAFITEVGQISEPVKTEFGWHIIKVESKSGSVRKTFSDWLKEKESKSLIIRLFK